MGTSKLIKLSLLIAAAVVIGLITLFGYFGEEEVQSKQEPDQSSIADNGNTSENVGFSDPSNLGFIVSQTPQLETVTPSGDVTQPQTTPAGVNPTEALRQEIELARLRQILESELADEINTRELRKEAMRSRIAPSQLTLTGQQGERTVVTQVAAPLNSALPTLSPSLVLANSSLVPASANTNQGGSTQVVQQTTEDLIGYSRHTPKAARSPYEIKKGSVIPGTLITEINSDIPGNVVGMVRRDVYDSVTGDHRLIPSGSRLFGLYDPSIDYAQKRINVVWTHMIFPNGDTLVLEDQQATDVNGQAGFADKRKGNFLANLGGNLLYSILSAGETGLQKRLETAVSGQPAETGNAIGDSIAGLGSQLGGGNSSAASVFNDKHSALPPTLQIRSGYRFNILVSKDIILEPS